MTIDLNLLTSILGLFALFYLSGRVGSTLIKSTEGFVNWFNKDKLTERWLALLHMIQLGKARKVQIDEFISGLKKIDEELRSFSSRFENPDRITEALNNILVRESQQYANQIADLVVQMMGNLNKVQRSVDAAMNINGKTLDWGALKQPVLGAVGTTVNVQNGQVPSTVEVAGFELEDAVMYGVIITVNGSTSTTKSGAEVKQLLKTEGKPYTLCKNVFVMPLTAYNSWKEAVAFKRKHTGGNKGGDTNQFDGGLGF